MNGSTKNDSCEGLKQFAYIWVDCNCVDNVDYSNFGTNKCKRCSFHELSHVKVKTVNQTCRINIMWLNIKLNPMEIFYVLLNFNRHVITVDSESHIRIVLNILVYLIHNSCIVYMLNASSFGYFVAFSICAVFFVDQAFVAVTFGCDNLCIAKVWIFILCINNRVHQAEIVKVEERIKVKFRECKIEKLCKIERWEREWN